MTREFPLSRCQKGLYYDWQREPEGAIYNTASVFRVASPLDVDALRRAWQRVIDRHGCFRTTLVDGDVFPLQRRHDRFEARFFVHDASSWSPESFSSRLAALNAVPFDFREQSGFELHLCRSSEARSVVMLRFHHLFDDYASTDTIHTELFDAYAAEAFGRSYEWAPLPHEFDEFVEDERVFLESNASSDSLRFWEHELTHLTGELALPTDRRRVGHARRGATVANLIEGREAVATLARDLGSTRYRVLLAVYAVLLHRYSGEQEIVIGTPADCRGKKFAGVGGNFVNMLPFRLTLDPAASFADVVRHVDERVREATAHRRIPFPDMVERFWRGATNVTPFFRATFGFTAPMRCRALDRSQMTTHVPWEAEVGGLVVGNGPSLPQQEGGFDLGLLTWDLGDTGIAVEAKYDAGLFSEEAAFGVTEHYERILGGCLLNPGAPIGGLAYRTEVERESSRRLLVNAAFEVPFEPAHAAFERAASETPNAIAIEQGDRRWTYAEVERWANTLATTLLERGVKQGDLVGVLLPKSPEAVASFLGVLKCGAAFVPLDPAYPVDRIRYMLEDAKAAVVLTDAEHAPLASDPARILDVASIVPRATTLARIALRPDSPAYVIYTSGSTGQPKGVVVPHRGVPNLARALVEDWSLDDNHRVLGFAAFSFDAAIADIFPTFEAGAVLDLGDDVMPAGGEALVEMLARRRITHVTLPPSVWLSMPAAELPWLRVGISAGEACPREVVTRWGSSRTFFNNYGPTEVTVCATTKRCVVGEAPTIGLPIRGVEARVLDEAFEPVPFGVIGELFLSGEGLAIGYLGRPELTKERFVRDPHDNVRLYRTGDLVRFLASGDLEFAGRRDEQVKLRGFRIELVEIEEAMRAVPGVIDAAATVSSVGATRILAGFVVGDSKHVVATLKKKLPKHMVPAVVVPIAELPRSPSGKVDRSALVVPPIPEEARVPFTGETEEKLAVIWREVLGHDEFGATDEFFSIGGDSLNTARVLHLVAERLGRDFGSDALMRAPSIRELASLLTQPPESSSAVVELAAGDSALPALVLVHPAGGDLAVYRHLVAALAGRRIFGVRCPADANDASIDDLAERYAKDIEHTIDGPIVLFGWSLGGVIAHAISRVVPRSRVQAMHLVDALPVFPRHIAVDAELHGDPELLRQHKALYQRHTPRWSSVPAFVYWASETAAVRGAWSAHCEVVSERELAGSHYDVLTPPRAAELAASLSPNETRQE